MSNIDTINVGGLDYSVEDSEARGIATGAVNVSAYVENGNTASRAYPTIGTPINWKGSLYYTKATITAGSTLSTATNLTAAANLGAMIRNIKTYVGTDSKLHFTDATGADSVLNFSGAISACQVSFKLQVSGTDITTKSLTCSFLVLNTKNGLAIYGLANNSVSSTGTRGGQSYAISANASASGFSVSKSGTIISIPFTLKVSGTMDGTNYATVTPTIKIETGSSTYTISVTGSTSVSKSGVYGSEPLNMYYAASTSTYTITMI